MYRGDRTACSVEGLHFDTEYRTRVKAVNRVGYSAYSGVVRIHTAEGSINHSLYVLSIGPLRYCEDLTCIGRYMCAWEWEFPLQWDSHRYPMGMGDPIGMGVVFGLLVGMAMGMGIMTWEWE